MLGIQQQYHGIPWGGGPAIIWDLPLTEFSFVDALQWPNGACKMLAFISKFPLYFSQHFVLISQNFEVHQISRVVLVVVGEGGGRGGLEEISLCNLSSTPSCNIITIVSKTELPFLVKLVIQNLV